MALEAPATLSPSKIDKFTHCPLAFRFSYLDRVPEPSSIQQVRGTLVHRALEMLFSRHAGDDRTPFQARAALDEAWSELRAGEEARSLHLDEAGETTLVRESAQLLTKYFAIEDPTGVASVGLELHLHADLDGVVVNGIIDRLDDVGDGNLVIVDYKTGRSPRPEQSRSRLAGVHFYAFLCEQVYGTRPSELRLLYLRDQVVVATSTSEQSMRGLRQRVLAVWAAIERACGDEDFRPNPSPLCRSCGFQTYCPAFGGRIAAGVAAGVAAVGSA